MRIGHNPLLLILSLLFLLLIAGSFIMARLGMAFGFFLSVSALPVLACIVFILLNRGGSK